MVLNKRDSEVSIHYSDEKTKSIHWILYIVCAFFYLCLNAAVIRISDMPSDTVIFNISKFTLSGLAAQGQVIAVILLTLNPLKRSHQAALVLCAITSAVSLVTVLMRRNFDAMPGVIVPLTSGAMSIIISNYAKRLKSQLNRVVEYSRIVKRNEEMLQTLAYYDTLTGLPNRKALMDQIDSLTSRKDGAGFYLVYIDIDDFKNINDTMGHSVGDTVLKSVAQRWQQVCHHEDLFARVGGDEFIVLICHEVSAVQLHDYLHRFYDAVKVPIRIGRVDFHIGISFGVTRYPHDGDNAEELLKNVDIALYKAKKHGKNDYQFFSNALKVEVLRKIRLENDLMSAVGNQELFLVYQPQYHCGSLKLRGFEALIRWRHPELGLISPIEFIPIAEELGMINDIGKWVIKAALESFVKLRQSEKINTMLSINISVKQLLDLSFVAMVGDILKKTGFESRYLEFEITESVFISSPDFVIGVMNKLKELGIGIALDDFGTRYASLNYLQMLPINILKIDKTFIDKIAPSHLMTGAIISLSHMLGFEVVAEGVEQQQQMDYLTAQHCDYIQGYLLSRPVEEQHLPDICKESYEGLLASQ